MSIEYKMISLHSTLGSKKLNLSPFEDEFNQLAQKNWRFVRFAPTNSAFTIIAVFEREK